MSKMDSQQSRYVEKYQSAYLKDRDADEDELLAELEDELDNDTFTSSYREQRLQELSKEFKQVQQSRISIDSKFGNIKTLSDEKQVIQETVDNKLTIIHFYKQDFQTCKTMDEKLAQLSVKHLTTNFLRMDVIKSPFLVTKLNIKMLPCVLLYINGIEADRIVGFERLGSTNGVTFSISALEDLLYRVGVINRKSTNITKLRGKLINRNDDDDEGDLDI